MEGVSALPTVSIILPAYNAQAYLERAVQSVRTQYYTDWELLLIDDGSMDATPEMCDRFAADDARIRVIHKENAGVSCARNDGIDAAAGELIAFLDADDWYETDYLSAMLDALQTSGADSAACGFFYAYADGRTVSAPAPLSDGMHDISAVADGYVKPLLCDRVSASLTLGTIWRCLFRKSVLLENAVRFSGAYLEDELFLIEYFSLGQNLVCVDRPLYNYNQNDASVTHRYLADYNETFSRTLNAKAALVERFGIDVPDNWRDNSAWAGLLIAVSNLFAPGAPGSVFSRSKAVKALCALPVFEGAYRNYVPTNMSRNKQIVASLLRKRLFLTLSLLYTFKNRNR